MSSDQQAELDSRLLSLYSKQNPQNLSGDSLNRLSPGDFRYVLKNARLDFQTLEEIRQEIESEKKQKIVWEVITQTARYAYGYARNVIKGEFPEGEAAIAQDAEYAYYYALDVIGGRFPAGEAAIAQDPEWAYGYAINLIGGRFPAGEAAIAQDADYAYAYAFDVIKELEGENRWPAGEAAIAQTLASAYYYALDVIEGRWPEPHRDTAEANIKKSASRWTEYMELVKQSENQ